MLNTRSAALDFICLVGIDGCGKSTLIRSLLKRHLSILSHWQIFKTVTYLPVVSSSRDPGMVVRKLPSYSRSLYLEYLIILQLENIILPALKMGLPVFSDSYYFKIYAKEKIFQKCNPQLFDRLDSLPIPKMTLFLDVRPELAFERKKKLKGYEYFVRPTRKDFITFQTQVRKNMLSLLKDKPHCVIDANQEKENVYQQVVNYLSKHEII